MYDIGHVKENVSNIDMYIIIQLHKIRRLSKYRAL